MVQDQYQYLFIDLFSFAVPFLFSFERKWLHFIGQWRSILFGLGLMSAFFMVWDILFTHWGVWGFNDQYLVGLRFIGLPIEAYLFFLLIGFCSLFVYASMNHIIQNAWPEKWFKRLLFLIGLVNLMLSITHTERLYTFWAPGLNALAIFIILRWGAYFFSWKKFSIGYIVSFIPFMVVNGMLTGRVIPQPIAWYNNNENLGIRRGTIPIEDSQYMMLMMISSIYGYEWCKNY